MEAESSKVLAAGVEAAEEARMERPEWAGALGS